jgi:NAD(P)-dependent dehydrogenase (short-subunit alcohol dehydrogenase family)
VSNFEGQVAVITGGSSGIGAATAMAIAGLGGRVVIAARGAERLEKTVSLLRAGGREATGVVVDVSDADAVQRLADIAIDAYGQVDIVMLNAGVSPASTMLDIDLSVWTGTIDTHVRGLLNGIRTFLPILQAQNRGGSVLATCSSSGIHGTCYRWSAYAATKTAQLTIMECLYGELRDAGSPIHVGVVIPPLTRTGLLGDDPRIWAEIEADLASSGGTTGVIEPDEFAQVVIEGIWERRFWIETTEEQNVRLYGGRNSGTARRSAEVVLAKAAAMLTHKPPDPYLW